MSCDSEFECLTLKEYFFFRYIMYSNNNSIRVAAKNNVRDGAKKLKMLNEIRIQTSTNETFSNCQQTPENVNFFFAIFGLEPLRTT